MGLRLVRRAVAVFFIASLRERLLCLAGERLHLGTGGVPPRPRGKGFRSENVADKQQETIWQARMKEAPSARHVAYCAGRDVAAPPMADAVLIPYDLWVNQAHALMLAQTGIIDRATGAAIQQGLAAIERDWRAGTWTLDPALEDVHVNIERTLSARAGEAAGGRLHTARSRNDQTATDVRMFVRDVLLDFQSELLGLIAELLAQGRAHERTLMPGMTHTQPSSPTTLGHFWAAHAQAFLRDAEQIRATYGLVNVSPLGAAAGYGTSWPINREATARWLGFDGVQENSIDCVSSRWEMEARCVADLAFAGNHLGVLAQDLILWSQPWVGFVRFSDRHVTGSSIMPQKRNPDFAEVTRAKAAVVAGMLQALLGLNKGSVSGYNRDSQWSKYLVIDAATELREAPAVFREALAGLAVDAERMAAAAQQDFLVAVDLADTIAREGAAPFRQAYEIVARLVRDCESAGRFRIEAVEQALADAGLAGRVGREALEAAITPARSVQKKRSMGGPAQLALRANLERLHAQAEALQAWQRERRDALAEAREAVGREIEKTGL